jgi:hypothetical protein
MVSIALMKQMAANPRTGWVRADQAAGPLVMAELTRLSSENAELRKQAETAQLKARADDQAEVNTLLDELEAATSESYLWYEDSHEWTRLDDINLLTVFDILAPQLMVESSVVDISRFIGLSLAGGKPIRKQKPVPMNWIKIWMATLNGMGVAEPSSRKHLASDTNEYWTLTKQGRRLFAAWQRRGKSAIEMGKGSTAQRKRRSKKISRK